jgi:hypothetical protein
MIGRFLNLYDVGSRTIATTSPAGRSAVVAAITYPSNRTFIYTFDYAGRPTGVTISGVSPPLVSNARYLPFGPLTEFTYGSGDKKVVAYHSRYRVASNQLVRNGTDIASPLRVRPRRQHHRHHRHRRRRLQPPVRLR